MVTVSLPSKAESIAVKKMKCLNSNAWILLMLVVLSGCAFDSAHPDTKNSRIIYLAGDSTVADHTENDDYWTHRHPRSGWGQAFPSYFSNRPADNLPHRFGNKPIKVINKAKGGRSTRSFFEEGRWSEIYQALQPNDLVLIQFGHNDAAVEKPERYVSISGYQEYLRLFIQQARAKGAIPVLLTPVARNYPWENGILGNAHGEYPQAMREIAREQNVFLIDLLVLSQDFFSGDGESLVRKKYFMNLEAGEFPAYPDGLQDDTHFKPAGAEAIAKLVYDALQALPLSDPKHVNP